MKNTTPGQRLMYCAEVMLQLEELEKRVRSLMLTMPAARPVLTLVQNLHGRVSAMAQSNKTEMWPAEELKTDKDVVELAELVATLEVAGRTEKEMSA